MITYRHPTDTHGMGRPVTVERDERDYELEHYGWVELDGEGHDVHRDDETSDESTGGDGRLDERTDVNSVRHDPAQTQVERPEGRTGGEHAEKRRGNRIVTKG